MKCRHCHADLVTPFIDLGKAPPSNAYRTAQTVHLPEKTFSLKVLVCTECWLVQTEDVVDVATLFPDDYAYFSSFSTTWLAHAERYAVEMTDRFGLNTRSRVIEIAANDGYLLQFFRNGNIPCLGIEPTAGPAAAARDKGLRIVEDFFGVRLARDLVGQGWQADLTVANNVLAHVPDINDFVAGFAILLAPHGVATFEFPHLQRLVAGNQFDTIYHEHFSYLSLLTVNRVFERGGLSIFDVQELPTHGGSLRVFAQRSDSGVRPLSPSVTRLLEQETAAGMATVKYYSGFQARADRIRDELVRFLTDARRGNRKVAAYGAAAKGNTLLNYAGVGVDLISFVADRNPSKQGKFLPGSHIPVKAEICVRDERPDYVILLPWNLREELMTQLAYIRDWHGRFVTAIPSLEIR